MHTGFYSTYCTLVRLHTLWLLYCTLCDYCTLCGYCTHWLGSYCTNWLLHTLVSYGRGGSPVVRSGSLCYYSTSTIRATIVRATTALVRPGRTIAWQFGAP